MKSKISGKLNCRLFFFLFILQIRFVPFLVVGSWKCFGPPKPSDEVPGNGKPWVGLLPALPVVDGVQDLSAYEISDHSGQLKLTEATLVAKSFQKGSDLGELLVSGSKLQFLWLVPLYAQQNDKTRRPMEGDDHKEIEVGIL